MSTITIRENELLWSTKINTPSLDSKLFFLNENNHLCLDGDMFKGNSTWIRQMWCLADFAESTEWIQMPQFFDTPQLQLIGTLPAKIITSMITTNKEKLFFE